MTWEQNQLMHFGILGQKWGVRRYQNPDGTLMPEGATRYGRGKNLNKEYNEISAKERKRIEKENSPKLDKLYDDLRAVTEKYGLDGDDGGGGYTNRFSNKELTLAKKKFWDLSEKIYDLEEGPYDEARSIAKQTIIKKYGETAMSDIKHYKNVKGFAAVSALLASVAGITVLAIRG